MECMKTCLCDSSVKLHLFLHTAKCLTFIFSMFYVFLCKSRLASLKVSCICNPTFAKQEVTARESCSERSSAKL